jgi:spore germination protein GerM
LLVITRRNRLFSLSLLAVLLLSGCARKVLTGHMGFSNQDQLEPAGKSARKPPAAGEMQVFFVKAVGDKIDFAPVERKVQGLCGTGERDYLEFVCRELLKGPSGTEAAAGLASEIPRAAVLICVQEQSGSLIVDLSKHFVQGGGLESFETRMEQLRHTVSQKPIKHKVFLNIEGQRLTETPGEGLEIKQPLN